jgi:ATP/maltotriose-dependent transcriptional regulator MalT
VNADRGDAAHIGAIQAQLDADYEAIDIDWLEGRLTRYIEQATPLRDRALAIGDEARAAEIVSWMASAAVNAWDSRADDYVDQAERLADAAGLPVVGARMLRARARLAYLRGDPSLREAADRDELARAEASGDSEAIVLARRSLGEGLMGQRRFGEAEASLSAALELSRQIGDVKWRTEILCGKARLALERGDVESADSFVAEALAGVREEDLTGLATARLALAEVRAAQSRDGAAESSYRDALAVISSTEYRQLAVDVSISYARFLAERGRAADVESQLRPIERLLEDRGYPFRATEIAEVRGLANSPQRSAGQRGTGSASGSS